MWYKREERTYRVALFFSAASLAGAFGGILAYVRCSLSRSYCSFTDTNQGIGFMNRIAGLKGWAWIFIIVSMPPLLTHKSAKYVAFKMHSLFEMQRVVH